jgi:hypothetical protein
MDLEIESLIPKEESLIIDQTEQGLKLFYCTFEGILLFK